MKELKAGALVILMLFSSSATAGKTVYNFLENLYRTAPPQEVMALPKFCWGRYLPQYKGAQYNISKEQCGPMVNHYCQGLLRFNRGMNPAVSRGESKAWISMGTGNINYTANGIKKYPACPIARHVHMMRNKAAAVKAAFDAAKIQPVR